jgi:hypothetical protein
MICRKYSFEKLTQFSHGNNALGVPVVQIDGLVLERNICFFNIVAFSYLEQTEPTLPLKHLVVGRISLKH